MNHVYRVVFNHALKCVQVVSEFARSRSTVSSSAARRAPQLAALSTAIALSCAAPAALAADPGWNAWLGGNGTNWATPGNWAQGEPTSNSAAAYIDSGRTAEVLTTGEQSNHLHVGDTGRGNLNILGGGQLTTRVIYIGTGVQNASTQAADGRVRISGAGSSWTALQTIGVGHWGSGLVDVEDGARLAVNIDSYIGSGVGSVGVVNVTGPDSSYTTGSNLMVGHFGNGTVTVKDGATVSARTSFVGQNAGATGLMEVSGAGSTWTTTDSVYIGESSTGTARILQGGTATAGSGLNLGSAANGNGSILITGADSSFQSSALKVGINGIGHFQVDDAAVATVNGRVDLAMAGTSRGTIKVGTDAVLAVGGATTTQISAGTGQGLFELAGGTLRANAALMLLSDVVVSADSTLDTQSGISAYRTFSGAGQLRKTGLSTLLLFDADSSAWTGGLQVDEGRVSVFGSKSVGTGVLGLADGTTLGLANAVQLDNSVQLQGEVAVEVADGASATLAGSTGGTSNSVLVKRDAGTLTLAGDTFAGATRVEGGTLRVADLSTGNLEIVNGRFVVDDGARATVLGSIDLATTASSNGTLTIGQDATLTLGGSTPASISTGTGEGQVELAGGTLQADTGVRVDSNVAITADSGLDATSDILLRGILSGSGQLLKSGSAALDLADADNSQWTGGLRVEAGMLRVAGSQALGTGVTELADGTSLELFDGVRLNNAVYLQGEVGIAVADGESATLLNTSGASDAVLVKRDAGTLSLNSSTFGASTRVEEGTLRVSGLSAGNVEIGSDATFEIDTTRVLTYDGQFSGDGTLRQGRHFLTLTGDSSGFAGTTVVNGGMLAVEGQLGGLTQLENTALLAGDGRLGSVSLLSGSTLSPGSRVNGLIGSMTLSGDLRFDASAIFQVDLSADGRSDHVDVAGSASLGNASTVAVAAEGDWQASTRYTLLTANDGVNGTFSGVTSNLAFLDPTLSYDANNVYLTMARNDVSMPDIELAFPDVVVNTNQQAVAGAVEALGEGNAVYDAVVRLEVPQVVPAFDSLSGEVHAAHRGTLLQNRFLHDGIDRHLDGRAVSGDIAPGVRVWLAGSGGQQRTDATASNTATRVSQDGLMAGAGWQIGEALEVGVAAGQQRLETRLRSGTGQAETDSTEYGVYAAYQWQGLRLRGGVTRADYRTDSTRTAQVGTTLSETLTAREDATGTTAFVRAGWTFGGSRLQLTPEIELAQVNLDSDGSQERGGDSALVIGSADSDYRTGVAALKADWDISGGQRDRAVLTARVGWQYADGDRLPVADARFASGARDFSIAGTPLARSTALAQLGVAISPSANSRVSLQVQGRRGGEQRELGAQLDWSVGF